MSANPRLPICCSDAAYDALQDQLRVLETSDGLVRAAAAIARHQIGDEADPQRCERQVAVLASTVARRVRGRQTQGVLAHLHEFLFEEEHFAGNSQDYYNPQNSYLPSVLSSHLGLPISLCMVYKAVAERLGLRVWGLGLPGHFLAGTEVNGKMVLVDPFAAGRLLNVQEARERLLAQFGKELQWSDAFLEPVSHRYWLTRNLQNLISAFGREGRYEDVAAVLEMEMLLWPSEPRLQRDLALVLARIGRSDSASEWLDFYLQNNPGDPNRGELRQLLSTLST
jgi:regulator of sirC expression with transglutaminase-like and TPR domain